MIQVPPATAGMSRADGGEPARPAEAAGPGPLLLRPVGNLKNSPVPSASAEPAAVARVACRARCSGRPPGRAHGVRGVTTPTSRGAVGCSSGANAGPDLGPPGGTYAEAYMRLYPQATEVLA